MKVGIPRALFYYYYFPFWKTFFESLGQEVVLSGPTNKKILKDGIKTTVDDACLPVKVFHGHVVELCKKTDVIFIPRIVSIEPGKYICPKFLGLPDMVKNNINGLPLIIDSELNLYKSKQNIFKHIFEIGQFFQKSKLQTFLAYCKARKKHKKYVEKIKKFGMISSVLERKDQNDIEKCDIEKSKYKKIMLLGHPYNIFDHYINMNLIKKLQKNKIELITFEMVQENDIIKGSKKLNKQLFWTLGENILGSAYYYLDNKMVDGVIHVAAFGCGPDSLVGELLEKRIAKEYKLPFLYINLDEQSGAAGFNTRLEAFLDILEGRNNFEGNISSHG